MKIISSKKAAVELSLQQIIGIAIAVAIIIGTLSLFLGLMNLFVQPPDSGSMANMGKIHDAVLALYSPLVNENACYIDSSYIKDDWVIVGFNSDGVRTADNTFFCERGKDCIEEQCSMWGEQNIIKPSSKCGTGPCLCLCQSGGWSGIGDVDGDDCDESNAPCKKFSPDAEFNSFYFLEEEGECKIKYSTIFEQDKDRMKYKPADLCDLVIDSEECASGRDRKVVYRLVIMKGEAVYPGSRGKDAVVFDLVKEKDEFREYYNESMPRCQALINKMREPKPAPEQAAAEQPAEQEETLPRDLDIAAGKIQAK